MSDFTLADAAAITCSPYLARELRSEAVWAADAAAEAKRFSGVSMSGMGPTPRKGRTDDEICAAAEAAERKADAFAASPRGRFLASVIELGTLGYNEAETVRSIYCRSLATPDQPLNHDALLRAIRILNSINHPTAREGVRALCDIAAPIAKAA